MISATSIGRMPRVVPVACLCAASAAAAVVLAGCGGGGSGRVAVRVAGSPITAATVAHWMSVLATEHHVPDPPSYAGCVHRQEALALQSVKAGLKEECRRQYGELRQRALDFLIAAHWLTGEAAAQGLHAGGREAAQRLQGGPKPSILQSGGTTAADERLAVEAELASAKIRQALVGRLPRSTHTQIAGYYHAHIARYKHPEVRDTYIVEHLSSMAQAARLRREVASGTRDIRNLGLREMVDEPHPVNAVPGKAALARAIFAARPHTVSSLLLFDREPAFFEVMHVTPGYVQPLAQVERSIEGQLAGELQRRTLSQFVGEWRRRWIARTDCKPGYVVQKCRQYRGPRTAEDSLALS
jgi:foldase protein PrsA